jgi:hypothetical protein
MPAQTVEAPVRAVHRYQLDSGIGRLTPAERVARGKAARAEQLRDWKYSLDIETMIPEGLRMYGALCGWTLARAHARSGDRIAIAAYLGNSDVFDRAVTKFAVAYAEQNERDYQALVAVASGRITAERGL